MLIGALNIRLAGGSTGFEGRVEQYYAGSWSTVCDDGWDLNNAKVVCRQVGLGGAVRATTGSFFGRGAGRAILSDVDCTGSETALGWCLHSGWISRSCSQTAGVVCEGKVKLKDVCMYIRIYVCLCVCMYPMYVYMGFQCYGTPTMTFQ